MSIKLILGMAILVIGGAIYIVCMGRSIGWRLTGQIWAVVAVISAFGLLVGWLIGSGIAET